MEHSVLDSYEKTNKLFLDKKINYSELSKAIGVKLMEEFQKDKETASHWNNFVKDFKKKIGDFSFGIEDQKIIGLINKLFIEEIGKSRPDKAFPEFKEFITIIDQRDNEGLLYNKNLMNIGGDIDQKEFFDPNIVLQKNKLYDLQIRYGVQDTLDEMIKKIEKTLAGEKPNEMSEDPF